MAPEFKGEALAVVEEVDSDRALNFGEKRRGCGRRAGRNERAANRVTTLAVDMMEGGWQRIRLASVLVNVGEPRSVGTG